MAAMLCVSEGYRRIDHVIGIAAEIVLNGKVIKTVASSPFVLKKHKAGFVVEDSQF